MLVISKPWFDRTLETVSTRTTLSASKLGHLQKKWTKSSAPWLQSHKSDGVSKNDAFFCDILVHSDLTAVEKACVCLRYGEYQIRIFWVGE